VPYTKKFERTLYSPEWLRRVYVEENRNAAQVAALIGCTRGAVLDALRKHGVAVKTASEAWTPRETGSDKPRPRAKFKDTLHNPEWLKSRLDAGARGSDIARELGCSVTSACRAIKLAFDLDVARRPSPRTPERLAEMRSRAQTRRLYPEAQPCKVCGDPDGTRNHIDANPLNNDPSNIEWLCMKHHLMVDKRLGARAVRWFRENHLKLWLEWHDEVLAEVRLDPEPRSMEER